MKRALLFCLAAFSFSACAKHPPQQGFVLDGPPLFVAAEFQGISLEGTMERKSMVGIGEMFLASPDKYLDCRAEFNSPPTDKARIRGVLICTDKHRFAVTLRNLGPDQGVGLAMEEGKNDMLVLFYHPSAEEARRRLTQASADMLKARSAAQGLDSVPAQPQTAAAPQTEAAPQIQSTAEPRAEAAPQLQSTAPQAETPVRLQSTAPTEPQPVATTPPPAAAPPAAQADVPEPQADDQESPIINPYPQTGNAAPLDEDEAPAPAKKPVGFGIRYGTPAK